MGTRTLIIISMLLAGCSGAVAVQDDEPPVVYLEDELAKYDDGTDELPYEPPSIPPAIAEKYTTVPTSGNAFFTDYLDGSAESVGTPQSGSLKGGKLLPAEGPGYFHKGPAPYGTDDIIMVLYYALGEVLDQFPQTVPVVVGDLSTKGGGRFKSHKSHASGRDIDIGLYKKGNVAMKHFETLTAKTFDAEKTWALVEAMLITKKIQYIFLDYSLQKPLRQAAVDAGWDPGELDAIFQYPDGKKTPKGIIRHAAGHRHHLHVRILCPPDDEACKG